MPITVEVHRVKQRNKEGLSAVKAFSVRLHIETSNQASPNLGPAGSSPRDVLDLQFCVVHLNRNSLSL